YALFKTLPLSIFRAKGIVNLDAVPQRRVILQMVGKRVILSKGEPWGVVSPSSRVVMIGPADALDHDRLRKQLEGCVARGTAPPPSRLTEAVLENLRRP
ncbi:MAG: GTP-binding protein, partial [Gammaproteobacteria bacterium]